MKHTFWLIFKYFKFEIIVFLNLFLFPLLILSFWITFFIFFLEETSSKLQLLNLIHNFSMIFEWRLRTCINFNAFSKNEFYLWLNFQNCWNSIIIRLMGSWARTRFRNNENEHAAKINKRGRKNFHFQKRTNLFVERNSIRSCKLNFHVKINQ